MIRSALTIATVTAIAIGVSAAIAQEDPIKARKALMKANGDEAKIGAAMIKGDMPFNLAAVTEFSRHSRMPRRRCRRCSRTAPSRRPIPPKLTISAPHPRSGEVGRL